MCWQKVTSATVHFIKKPFTLIIVTFSFPFYFLRYDSEMKTGHRNMALLHYIKSKNVILALYDTKSSLHNYKLYK